MGAEATAEPISTGVHDVDGEHEMQLSLLSGFVDAVAEDRTPAELDEILDRLLDYSKVHFMSEELLMRLYSYAGYEAHVQEHERTVDRIEALRDRHAAGDAALTRESAGQLRHWIVRHIRETDRSLGHFLKEMRAARV